MVEYRQDDTFNDNCKYLYDGTGRFKSCSILKEFYNFPKKDMCKGCKFFKIKDKIKETKENE